MIISAFPACGKTYLCKNKNKLKFKYQGKRICYSFIDSNSSKFKGHNGWEKEYVDYIEENIGKVDFILTAQHEGVMLELKRRNIPFVTVTPESGERYESSKRQKVHDLTKQQWFGRFMLRDNSHIREPETWIRNMMENYDTWVSEEYLSEYNSIGMFSLRAEQYLSDIIEDLYWIKENR